MRSRFCLTILLLTTACTTPTPEFSDPLATIGRSARSDSPYTHLTLGVVLSDNAHKSMDHVAEHLRKYESVAVLKNRTGIADLDPQYLTGGINDVLTRRFEDVLRFESLELARSAPVDIIMVLDLRAEVASMSFQTTRIGITGIFINQDQREIGRVEGLGERKMPYPATVPKFKEATNAALSSLASALDQDNQLATAINASILERMSVASLPSQPALTSQHWTFGTRSGFGNYHALVIGNNHYVNLPQLVTAIADARSVGSVLEQVYGFQVSLMIDATRADILRALNQMRRSLTASDNLLIYYAGHGWLDADAGRGYWLPVDAQAEDPTNWVSNSSITDALRALQAKHVMVVADSCYSGTLTRGVNLTVPAPDFVERLANKRARTVLTSGGLEPVSDEGSEGHSVFARAFINALTTNKIILDGHTLFSNLRRPVMVNSNQTPEYGDIRLAGHDGGDFLFVPVLR
ncbi:MAG: caspase family protein [Pseudomonadales bacterium]